MDPHGSQRHELPLTIDTGAPLASRSRLNESKHRPLRERLPITARSTTPGTRAARVRQAWRSLEGDSHTSARNAYSQACALSLRYRSGFNAQAFRSQARRPSKDCNVWSNRSSR
jgi:hypothetical protein